jgi:hypothetical protein
MSFPVKNKGFLGPDLGSIFLELLKDSNDNSNKILGKLAEKFPLQ